MACEYRRKSDALFGRAVETTNLNDRSRLIDEAIYWRSLAADNDAPAPTDSVQKVLGEMLGDKPRHAPD